MTGSSCSFSARPVCLLHILPSRPMMKVVGSPNNGNASFTSSRPSTWALNTRAVLQRFHHEACRLVFSIPNDPTRPEGQSPGGSDVGEGR